MVDGQDPQKPKPGTGSEEADPSQEEFVENPSSSSMEGGQGSSEEEIVIAPTPEAKQYEYQHPLLKGKTPEEIERIVAAQEASIRSQDEELNKRVAGNRQDAAPKPVEEPDPEYDDDFLAPKFKTLEQRLTNRLNKMVEPLTKGRAGEDAKTVRETLRSELKHFSLLEPHINQLMRENGQDPNAAQESQLRMLYHTAVGLAHDRGIPLTSGEEAPKPKEEAVPTPPQNRPSAAPLPSGGGPKKRELTEQERRIAHEQFRGEKDPEGEYRKLQEADIEEVVQPGFSKDQW